MGPMVVLWWGTAHLSAERCFRKDIGQKGQPYWAKDEWRGFLEACLKPGSTAYVGWHLGNPRNIWRANLQRAQILCFGRVRPGDRTRSGPFLTTRGYWDPRCEGCSSLHLPHSLQRYHIELVKELIMRAKCVGPSAFEHVYGTAAMIIIIANDPSWACFHELWPNLHISFCWFLLGKQSTTVQACPPRLWGPRPKGQMEAYILRCYKFS